MHRAGTEHGLRVSQFPLRMDRALHLSQIRQASVRNVLLPLYKFYSCQSDPISGDTNKDGRWRTKWETNYCSLSFALQCRKHRNSRSNFCHHRSLGLPPPCSPGVAESDTAAGTDIDELMLSAAHTSSHLLLDSHFLPPMKAYKELHLRSIIWNTVKYLINPCQLSRIEILHSFFINSI